MQQSCSTRPSGGARWLGTSSALGVSRPDRTGNLAGFSRALYLLSLRGRVALDGNRDLRPTLDVDARVHATAATGLRGVGALPTELRGRPVWRRVSTPDLRTAEAMLFQLSYHPMSGEPASDRTSCEDEPQIGQLSDWLRASSGTHESNVVCPDPKSGGLPSPSYPVAGRGRRANASPGRSCHPLWSSQNARLPAVGRRHRTGARI